MHHWADLQSVHGFRCYGNILNPKCQRGRYYSLYTCGYDYFTCTVLEARIFVEFLICFDVQIGELGAAVVRDHAFSARVVLAMFSATNRTNTAGPYDV